MVLAAWTSWTAELAAYTGGRAKALENPRQHMRRGPTTLVYWGYVGRMEKTIETIIVCWGYAGIMGNSMETAIVYWV